MTDTGIFPFGAPVRPYERIDTTPKEVFILGAYPSALHVAWTSPTGERVQALPVDNEPEPFWNGADLDEHLARWRARAEVTVVGEVAVAPEFNGPSGVTLDSRYLRPLHQDRADSWITDCLPLYCMSAGVKKALDRTKFDSLMDAHDAPRPDIDAHPSEAAIIKRSAARHDTIVAELSASKAPTVVTLGNAALAVLHHALGLDGPAPTLERTSYGTPITITEPHHATWLPLAHPGLLEKNGEWSKAHARWEKKVVS